MKKLPIINEKDLDKLIVEALKGNGILAIPQEISQMVLNIKGVSINSKPRKDGRYQGYIDTKEEKKYVYGRTKDEVAVKLKKLLEKGLPRKKERNVKNGIPLTFNAFAQYYFENFRKKKVVAETYRADLSRYKNHILPVFGEMPLKSIMPDKVQKLIDKLTNAGLGKTADEVYSLLNGIFKMAIKHGLIQHNPVDVIFHIQHERETGKELNLNEIKALISAYNGTKYLDSIMVYLYTGLRPNELETARIDGNFIIAINSKNKGKVKGKVQYKKIPIVDELRPYIKNGLTFCPLEYLRSKIKAVTGHTIKDLRKTFYSRCIECKVNDTVRELIVGHSLGKVNDTYTGLSDDFLVKEMQKFYYEL